MSFVYEINPNSAQSTQMKINLAATVLLSALPGEEDLQLRHTSGFDINLAFQDNTWHEKISQFYREFLLENTLGHVHLSFCTIGKCSEGALPRACMPLFACLKLATCQIHQLGLSQWPPIYHRLWQVEMCGLHHVKLRLASIIVTENELM